MLDLSQAEIDVAYIDLVRSGSGLMAAAPGDTCPYGLCGFSVKPPACCQVIHCGAKPFPRKGRGAHADQEDRLDQIPSSEARLAFSLLPGFELTHALPACEGGL